MSARKAIREVLRAARVYVHNLAPPERRANHRAAVGGMWDVIGPLQFDFMRDQGLRPEHRLLDIGCGSLRAGRFFISYLNPRCYLGLDSDESLVRTGLATEIDAATISEKQPEFAFNNSFSFPFNRKPDFALAQSVFTHLTPNQMETCLANLHAFAPNCKFFVTFNESSFAWPNGLFAPNTQRTFFYTRGQIAKIAEQCGWSMSYIGEWGHPRDQRMVLLTNRG
ncbi:MAG TPA: class I SAM-dependent methyltransferase [Xanthobacteraceae bacterium]|nr:class I SAM-dependent methyltransferase [Xanthobacteraceae bacterium]